MIRDDWEADRQVIAERLGWTVGKVRPGAVISLVEMADLLGVTRDTPNQWRQRSATGRLSKPMPAPDPEMSKPDKPLWRLSTILRWFKDTNRWPPGRIARPERRGSHVRLDKPAPVLFRSPPGGA